jgi:hypothetical protein
MSLLVHRQCLHRERHELITVVVPLPVRANGVSVRVSDETTEFLSPSPSPSFSLVTLAFVPIHTDLTDWPSASGHGQIPDLLEAPVIVGEGAKGDSGEYGASTETPE